MPEDSQEDAKTMRQNVKSDVDEYLEQGGKIQQIPAKAYHWRKLDNALPVRMVRPHMSEWEEEELTKAELLLSKLNISGNDPLAVRGTAPGSLTTFDVWAALANIKVDKLGRHPVWGMYTKKKLKLLVVNIQIYKQTLLHDGKEDQRSRGMLYSVLLELLLDRKTDRNWDIRKPHILEGMIYTALSQLCNPARFRDKRTHGRHEDSRHYHDHRELDEMSARAWAKCLNLSDHKDWERRWKTRYFDFLNDITVLDLLASDQIEGQL